MSVSQVTVKSHPTEKTVHQGRHDLPVLVAETAGVLNRLGAGRIWLRVEGSGIVVDLIQVPYMARGRGHARRILAGLVATADAYGWRLALDPDDGLGSDVDRLVRFYGTYGFVPDRGHRTGHLMIRHAV